MIGIRHEGATMSEAGSEYRFVIETYSPETMPASQLAEYMTNLGRLFGENEHMHFVRLECGSTALVQAVESEAVSKTRNRFRTTTNGNPPTTRPERSDH